MPKARLAVAIFLMSPVVIKQIFISIIKQYFKMQSLYTLIRYKIYQLYKTEKLSYI